MYTLRTLRTSREENSFIDNEIDEATIFVYFYWLGSVELISARNMHLFLIHGYSYLILTDRQER